MTVDAVGANSIKYEAEKVMYPILRVWFGYDSPPHDVEHHAENAAVDLSWALAGAGLLAAPAPVGLTEEERELVEDARAEHSAYWIRLQHPKLLAIIDRLSAAPVDDRERVPEGWRVEWPLSASGRPFRPRLVPVSPSVDPEEKP